ncbi:glycosyltransferase [uncultured Parasphingorhabdus sp.]|uniref:glycosyltransferase n=1 Tax=uncultured Parasphingorhabdus sp. TaxID=2709694 RepID=UPI0030D9B3C2|tara:strand:+ start:136660 stop:137535 length:876 start_codon:yes stop_codon:yes gene_type:complete
MDYLESNPQISLCGAAIVVVLYRPSNGDLAHLAELATWGVSVHVVVNDAAIEELLPLMEGLRWIKNSENVGLARALNQGIAAAVEAGSQYILLLDQDSRPIKNMLAELIAAAKKIESEGRLLACVAPSLYERKTAGNTTAGHEFAIGATFATSGTLLTKQGWRQIGPMWEALFIDGIDHEWCFRARAKGYETVLVQNVEMEHDMGESSIKILGRVRPIHRSPVRHYFIVRNTLWLQRKSYIPISWRLAELFKLVYRIPAYIFSTDDRKGTLINIMAAIVDGLTGREKRQPV